LHKLIKKEADQRLGVDVVEKESDRINVAQAQESLSRLRKYGGLPGKEVQQP
jgi:hypothetical protein